MFPAESPLSSGTLIIQWKECADKPRENAQKAGHFVKSLMHRNSYRNQNETEKREPVTNNLKRASISTETPKQTHAATTVSCQNRLQFKAPLGIVS